MNQPKMFAALGGAVGVLVFGIVGYFQLVAKPPKTKPPRRGGGTVSGDTSPQARPRQDRVTPRASAQPARNPPRKLPGKPGARVRLRYEVLLRSRSIHLVSSKGKILPTVYSIKQLITLGQKAQREDRDLVLRVQGDAKAQWVKDVKQALSQQQVPFSVANEF